MKKTRIIAGAVAGAGIVIFILAFLGVFTPRHSRAPTQPAGTVEQPAVEITGFEAIGDQWILRARKYTSEGGVSRLIDPVLEVNPAAEKDPRSFRASAKRGRFSESPSRVVHLEDDVHLTILGKVDAELTTDWLDADMDAGTGRTDAPVTLTSLTEKGEQVIKGVGAEVNRADRTVLVKKDIRMEIAESPAIFAAGTAAPAAAPAPGVDEDALAAELPPKTIITADGPGTADGYRRTIVLSNRVVITQQDNSLNADKVTILYDENQQSIQRFLAEGAVAFKASGAEGGGDVFERGTMENIVTITGRPAFVRQGESRIESAKLEMRSDTGRLEAPGAGQLLGRQPAQGDQPEQNIEIAWQRYMTFDRQDRQATFRGDVQFKSERMQLACQSLRVMFDEQMKGVTDIQALEDVRMTAKAQQGEQETPVSAKSRQMTYRTENESVSFAGGAEVRQANRTIIGEQVLVNPKDGSMKVTGAGSLDVAADPADPKSRPVRGKWTGGMEFDRSTGQASFSRDVVLDTGDKKVETDNLLLGISDQNALESFDATGKARFQEKDPITGKTRIMTAGKMRGRLDEGASRPRELLAEPDVIIEEGDRIVRGDRLDVANEAGVLRGLPVELREADMVIYGERVEFDEKLGLVTVSSDRRVEGYIPRGARSLSEMMP